MLSFVFNKHTYSTCDVTTCAESAIHILQFLRITSELKDIVHYSKRSIGLFFHALSYKTIKKFVAILLLLRMPFNREYRTSSDDQFIFILF